MPKKKKIALLGNMNNNFSAICRYLLDCGYDAKLFTFDYEKDYPHFHPSADCYDDSWKAYTHELSWGSAKTYSRISKKYLKEFFEDFDIIIGCGYAPAFIQKAGRRLDIFAPHGSDINELPYLLNYTLKDIGRYLLVGLSQKKGIINSRHVFSGLWPKHKEMQISSLGLMGARHFSAIPFLYEPQYSTAVELGNDPLLNQVQHLKNSCDILIFHHIRHSWKNTVDPKGNDILFQGVSLFTEKNPDVRVKILTFEYGNDVLLSKELIKHLGLEGVVYWLPISNRKDIMKMMSFSDIVVGELHDSYCTYGAIVEGMILCKPIMHKRDDHLYLDSYENLYEMIHASTPADVEIGLVNYLANPDKYKSIGLMANNWVRKNLIDEPLSRIIQIIES
jgi:hypothetical protein